MKRRPVIVGGTVLALVVLVVVVAVATTGSGPERVSGPIAAALKTPDPVPRGPLVTSIPPDCGISPQTVRRLAPGAESRESVFEYDRQTCEWEAGNIAYSLGGANRSLEIGVVKNASMTNALSEFERQFASLPVEFERTRTDPMKVLPGLGAEAYFWYQTASEAPVRPGGKQEAGHPRTAQATILFRHGNLVVSVVYGGADYWGGDGIERPTKERALSREAALNGAVTAAKETAKSMGLQFAAVGGPVAPPRETPAERISEVCGLLPKAALERVGLAGATPRTTTGGTALVGEVEGTKPAVCEWGDLEIAAVAAPTAAQAARTYLGSYLYNRDDREPSDEGGTPFFHALTGVGDEAFIYVRGDRPFNIEVRFRIGNVVAGVGLNSGSTDRSAALNEGYTLAKTFAAALPR